MLNSFSVALIGLALTTENGVMLMRLAYRILPFAYALIPITLLLR